MSVAAEPVRLDFDDYVQYSDAHPEGDFELLDGVIYKLAPEGDPHLLTRSAIDWFLDRTLDLTRYAPWTEASFPAPGWFDGPRPDNFVSRGPGLVDGKICARQKADDIALVIEVSSTSRRKDRKKATLYARLGIPEYWLVDLIACVVVVHREPEGEREEAAYRSIVTAGRNETIVSSAVEPLSVGTDFLLQLAG
jgi:Uma2 family endonuclease